MLVRGDLPPAGGTAVSIIVRTLGRRRRWLAAALRSIDRQTHGAIEVVLIEDGPGALADLAREVPLGPGRALRYRHAPSLGMAKGGNLGVELATGRYLGFLDDDDELEPDHVTILAAALDREPAWGAVVAKARKVPVRSTTDEADWPADGQVVGPERVSRVLLHIANQMPIQSVLVRRDLLLRAGGFDPDLLYLEDWDLWLRCTALMPFGTVDAVTSRFRVPASRSLLRERALRHAPWRDRILAKLIAGGATVASDDVLHALDRLRERPEDYIPADRLARALVRRLTAALRRGPA